MTDTTCHMSISLDGFVAGPEQSRENPAISLSLMMLCSSVSSPSAGKPTATINQS
jgi:hypothetical protein